MAQNPIRTTYAIAAVGAQTALSVDWRDNATNLSYEVQFNGAATGTCVVETTLDDINDPAITADWVAETGNITADTRGVIAHPVQAIRLNFGVAVAVSTVTFKVLVGAQVGDTSGTVPSGGGAPSSNVNIAQVGGTAVVTGGVSGLMAVGGNSASGATDAGNPVKIGGVYLSTAGTLTTGQRGDLLLSANGGVVTGTRVTGADGVTNTLNYMNSALTGGTNSSAPTAVAMMAFNGTTWDRLRSAPYQVNQVPLIAGSGNVANAVAAATLTGTASTTVYLSGFEITGAGATAGLPVTVTVTGLLGGTRSYTYVFAAGVLLPNTPLQVEFNPPLPASAVNTAIVVSCPAGGAGNTNNTTVAHGFYQ